MQKRNIFSFDDNFYFSNPSDKHFYFRTGSIAQHPETIRFRIPKKLSFIGRKGLYGMLEVKREHLRNVTIHTPYPEAEIRIIPIPENKCFYINPLHVIGYSNYTMKRHWKLNMTALVMGKFKYCYFVGPVDLLVFGLGGLNEHVINEQAPANASTWDRNTAFAWDSGFHVSVTTRSSYGSAIIAAEDIAIMEFKGTGRLFTQNSYYSPDRSFGAQGRSKNTFMDYLNALIGLKG